MGIISPIKTHGFPGFGRTGFGRHEIYPDFTNVDLFYIWLVVKRPETFFGNHGDLSTAR